MKDRLARRMVCSAMAMLTNLAAAQTNPVVADVRGNSLYGAQEVP